MMEYKCCIDCKDRYGGCQDACIKHTARALVQLEYKKYSKMNDVYYDYMSHKPIRKKKPSTPKSLRHHPY